MAKGLSPGALIEVSAGSFVGMIVTGIVARKLKLGDTVRSRVTVMSLLCLGLGLALGFLVSRVRAPFGAGLAGGFGGMALSGLTSLVLLPSATLDQPVQDALPETVGFSGLLPAARVER